MTSTSGKVQANILFLNLINDNNFQPIRRSTVWRIGKVRYIGPSRAEKLLFEFFFPLSTTYIQYLDEKEDLGEKVCSIAVWVGKRKRAS